jgi:hypothetical protein
VTNTDESVHYSLVVENLNGEYLQTIDTENEVKEWLWRTVKWMFDDGNNGQAIAIGIKLKNFTKIGPRKAR